VVPHLRVRPCRRNFAGALGAFDADPVEIAVDPSRIEVNGRQAGLRQQKSAAAGSISGCA
jgi:hypothetical protein